MELQKSNVEEKELGLTENSVGRVHSDLVLGGISDQPLSICESDIGRSSPVTLIVSYDFNTIMLPNADAGVRRSEIDSDRRTFTFTSHAN